MRIYIIDTRITYDDLYTNKEDVLRQKCRLLKLANVSSVFITVFGTEQGNK
jgi:hypothetical protein